MLPPPATLEPGATTAPSPPAGDDERPPPAPADADLAPQLQAALDEWLLEQDVPGAVLGLRLADGRTAVVAAGSTDDEGGRAVEAGHRFRIGSITKTFVAALVLQLVDDGLVELDRPFGEHLPDAPFGERVTVRQLLSHSSGIPDFGRRDDYARLVLIQPGRVWATDEVVEMVADQPLDFEPGSRTAYSNTNYSLAGLLAEEVTGRSLAELLRERISEPAGLDATFLEALEDSPRLAVNGHFDIDGDGQPNNVRGISYNALVTSGAAAGGLSANALDVLDFAAALFEGELLSDAALAEMLDPPSGSYGLGIVRVTRAGHTIWGHDGALPGFSATFGHLPAEGVSFVVLANQTGANVHLLAEAALATIGESGSP